LASSDSRKPIGVEQRRGSFLYILQPFLYSAVNSTELST
jgi:hypothetical protein